MASSCSRPSSRLGFTLAELLLSLAIIGLLLALLLPAVQACREAARRLECRNHLRQQGLALHNFHGAHSAFPAGQDGAWGRNHSWCTAILPFLEQSALFDQYDYRRAWNDGSPGSLNLAVATTDVAVFVCPSTPRTCPGATAYGGVQGSTLTGLPCCLGVGRGWDSGVLVAIRLLGQTQPQRQESIDMAGITDGSSQTFLVVEDAGRTPAEGGQWANGVNCLAIETPPNVVRSKEIYSDHRVGAHVLLADGSVSLLSKESNEYVVGALATRNGGESSGVGSP